MHFVTPAPHSLYAIRLVSVIVVALGAVCLVWLGVLVGGRWGLRVGGWAGVVYVADPLTSRYAQEARPYALAMLFAVLSACLLVKWLQTLSPRWLVLYLAATVMLGYAQLLGLLVVAAHAVTVALVRGWPASRRWLVAWVPGVCAIAPLGFFAWRQRVAMSWHTKPVSAQLQAVIDEFGGNEMGFHLLLLALALGLAVTYSATRRRGRSPSPALHVGAPWLLLPSCLLFAWSQASPMFSDRYVMFCVPALCLLAGTGLAFMPWPAAVALAGLFAHLLMPMQQQVRSTVGHSEDVRGVALAVAATAEPGDAVVFIPADRRVVEEAYPEDFDKAADVLLARPGAAAGSIAGTDVPPGGVPAAILSHERVIVVGTPAAANVGQVGRAAMEVLARHFQPLEHQQFAGFTFTLYARS
jgi:mannosyltransferase